MIPLLVPEILPWAFFVTVDEELSILVVGCGAQHVKSEKPLHRQQDATKLKNATRWHQTVRTAPNIN